MAISQEQRSDLLTLIVGIFDGAPSSAQLSELSAMLDNGASMDEVADVLVASEQFGETYPSFLTAEDFGQELASNILGDTVSAQTQEDAANLVASYVNEGDSFGVAAKKAIMLLKDVDTTENPEWTEAKAILANKAAVAEYFALNTEYSDELTTAQSQAVVDGVSSDEATVAEKQAQIDAGTLFVDGGSSNTGDQFLTVGQDALDGTSGDDQFYAYIVNNSNTAESGDMINAGAGTDRLTADIGNSQNFAITLHTNSLEQFAVRGQADNNGNDSSDNNMNSNVQIDAERMVGTDWYESNNSRADVVIEDVRIERVEAYGDNVDQITKDITVAMVSTDSGDVDLDVYFDNHSLVKEGDNSSNSIDLTVGNQVESANFNPAAPLENLPYTNVFFEVDGQSVTLDLAAAGIGEVSTYDDMWVVMQEAFANAQASEEYGDLLANVDIARLENADTFFSRDGAARSADIYKLSISEGEITEAETGWTANDGLPSNNAFSANVEIGQTLISSNLITSSIVLDDVGRGSMGGDLVVGAMSTGETSDSTGVEQFDLYVDRNSELQNITSTANTLEEVYVINRDHFADSNDTATGSLTVTGTVDGNDGGVAGASDVDDEEGKAGTIDGYGFNDVRVLDASEMVGSVNFSAVLSENVVSKYLDVQDTAADASADNVIFDYDLGTNDDTLALDIDSANLVNAGTGTREDFELAVDGNGGNDTITVRMGALVEDTNDDDDADTAFTVTSDVSDSTNWYQNQKENANISVNGGAGDDVISTIGAGDANIVAGDGNDTVYTDNSGNVGATGANTVAEVQTITFGDAGDLTNQTQVTVTLPTGDEVTTTGLNAILSGDDAATVAGKVGAQLTAAGITEVDSISVDGNDVIITYTDTYTESFIATNGNVPSATVSSIATDVEMTAPNVVVGSDGTAATEEAAEVAVIEFADVAGASTDITLTSTDGATTNTVTLNDTDGNGTVTAFEATQQFAALDLSTYGYSVLESNPSLGRVAVQAANAGDVTAANLLVDTTEAAVGTYTANGTSVVVADAGTPVATVDGVDAAAGTAGTAEVQELVFTGADQAGTVTFGIDLDGNNSVDADELVTVNLTAGNAADVASQVATALNGVTGISAAVDGTDNDQVNVSFDQLATAAGGAQGTGIADITFADGAVKSASVSETTQGQLEGTANAATWVVNTVADADDQHVIGDLDSAGRGSDEVLFGATLTVTYSGASTRGESGVTSGAAVAYNNGFESQVTVETLNNLGNAQSINQAIKAAILGENATGNRIGDLLDVQDGPANTLVIESKIDGRFNEEDLQISINAVDVSTLSEVQKSALVATLNDLDNTSGQTYTDAQLQTRLDAEVDQYTTGNNLDLLNMAHDGNGNLLAGNESTSVSDNIVTLGLGEDVVVLGTDDESNDTLVYTGTQNGHDTVVNFTTTGEAADMLDFTAYLNAETSASGSAASAVAPAATLNTDTVADLNEVTVIDFAAATNQSWAGLNETNLLAALNNEGTESWGNIDEADLDAGNFSTLYNSDTYNHIVMIENDQNDGEYKVFNLVAENGGDFTNAQLVGTVDFGDTLDGINDANFVNA